MKITANLVDIIAHRIFPATIKIENDIIKSIVPTTAKCSTYILPPFVDAHIHIESSMLLPREFARIAVGHGTVAVVADPHEIANVLGKAGIRYFIENSKDVPFKFYFGAPSCVPSTNFETSGAIITSEDVEELFREDGLHFLSEMMNYPGVINHDVEVMKKIEAAKRHGKPIDGHCPLLSGENLERYVMAGISTDHECTSMKEAEEKIALGMTIQIRNGSAAKNFDDLYRLIDKYPDNVMLCSDDLKPIDLMHGHINLSVKKAIENGVDLFKTLRAATYNPVKHYNLEVGMLQVGDPADFIEVDNLNNFKVLRTYCNGQLVAENGHSTFEYVYPQTMNHFFATNIAAEQLKLHVHDGFNGDKIKMNVIGIEDGSIITKHLQKELPVSNGEIICKSPFQKLVVLNRYEALAKPAIAVVQGVMMHDIAIATSIAHDSHNIVAMGSNDEQISQAIDTIIAMRGGMVIVSSNATRTLPLPIAGLISDLPIHKVIMEYADMEDIVSNSDISLTSPFMTLSFLALLVIPELKLSDRGLFDANTFKFIRLGV